MAASHRGIPVHRGTVGFRRGTPTEDRTPERSRTRSRSERPNAPVDRPAETEYRFGAGLRFIKTRSNTASAWPWRIGWRGNLNQSEIVRSALDRIWRR